MSLAFDRINISIGWTKKREVMPVPLRRVFEVIKTGQLTGVLNVTWATYGDSIEKIRAKYRGQIDRSGDAKAARSAIDADKKELANAIFAGDFGYERKLEPGKSWKSSGVVCLDFDVLGQKLNPLWEKITADPHTAACFLSPSGDGLKALLRAPLVSDKAAFKRVFGGVWNYAKQAFGEEAEFTAEPNKMCYVSFDPDIYTNENCSALDVEKWVLAEAEKKPKLNSQRAHPDRDASPIKVKSALMAIPVAKLDEATWAKVGMALCHWSAGGDEGFRLWDEWSNHPDDASRYDPNAIDSRWQSWSAAPPEQPITIATLFQLAKDHRWPGYVTPNDYLASLYPNLVESHGQPFDYTMVNRKWKNAEGDEQSAKIWTPTDLNERFFAALLFKEGNDRDPAVFDQDENKWLRYDPERGFYASIKSEALYEPLDKLMREVASQTKHFCVDLRNLEFKFRDTRSLQPIVQRAIGLCAVRSEFWRWPPLVLPVRNGVLDTEKRTLSPHSPDSHFRGVVNVDFVAGAECPKWLQLLNRALPEDDIDLLQRYFGLVLVGRNVAQKLLILIGTPQSGKGVIARVLIGLIGQENVATLRTDQLEGRFELGRLRHKLLIYGGDVPSDFMSARGARMLKSITGEDPVSPEFKNSNETPAAEPIYGSVFVTANSRLRVRFEEDKEAWRRRIVLIPFEGESVSEADQVIRLDARLLDSEGAGILNWALQGLAKLDADGGKLLLNERQQAIRDALIEESESYVIFAKECVIQEEDSSMGATEAYEAYVALCHGKGWTPITAKQFSGDFKETVASLYGVTQSHDLPEGRGWHGVRLHRPRRGRAESARRNPFPTIEV